MGDSLRQQLVEKVAARLATISVANGYRSEAGAQVHVWRPASAVLDRANLPALVIRDTSDEVTDARTTGKTYRALGFEIDVVVGESGEVAAESARHIIADVQEAIGSDERWDSLARLSQWDGDSMVVDQAERKLVMAQVRFTILYDHGRWTPDTRV